jgi:ferric-dicitrate binding protein FerR (iron transport regulator)
VTPPSNDDTAVLPVLLQRSYGLQRQGGPEPADDTPAAELAKASPRRWWSRITVALCALLILVGGFAGGIEAQKQWGTSTTATGRTGGFPSGGFPGGGQPGGTATAAAAGTTGTVQTVDGTTIYVQTADGKVVTVKLDGKTTVSTTGKGKLADVKPGQSVTVQGTTGTDGTVTATSVTAQQKK